MDRDKLLQKNEYLNQELKDAEQREKILKESHRKAAEALNNRILN